MRVINEKTNWDTYIAVYDNEIPGVTTLRMDLINEAPIKQFKYVLVTGLNYESNKENRFPDDATTELLYQCEEDLIALLNDNCGNVFAGTFMSDLERLQYFYIKSKKGIETLIESFFKVKYPNFKYYINLKKDKKWTYYKDFLYPNKATLNYMNIEKVILNIEKKGDDLSQSRRIDYWLYFSTKEDANLFVNDVQENGFKLEEVSYLDETISVQIWKEDKVDIDVIFPLTNRLSVLAEKYNGEYDGWETFVIKS